MSARGKLTTPTATSTPMVMTNPRLNNNRTANEALRATRQAAPLSPPKIGKAVRCTGGDGDGGTAAWKKTKTAELTNTSRLELTARLEKPTIASTLRSASIRGKAMAQKAAVPRKERAPVGETKCLNIPSKHCMLRKVGGGKKETLAEEFLQHDSASVIKQPVLEMGVQTNEAEILDRNLLVGDIKLLLPSPQLAKEIDMARAETSMEQSRKSVIRTFSPHEHDEEQHLDELKQYMEHSYVSRRKPKKPPLPMLAIYEPHEYSSVFETMDEFFTRDVKKAESLTSIQERIKRKELELMSMFNGVDVNDKIESDSEGD
ncbi:uncharacterized protein LOC111592161 [Drosophila hydei]|uniref:Uncharacterized protein LOC111592161 n=1 Tax=Drosophila hydei TaxID=7224 RepID=A0A6J1L9X3_DROHY|nr:uncharacterized protein LOC111592161 [Drosophila hydei]